MQALINWLITTLNSTALSTYLMTNKWVWPVLEMAHFFGLCLLFGSLLVVDLRIVGVGRSVPIALADRFIKFTILGFAINVITGTLFVIGDSDRYLVNIAFMIKMVLIAVAGVNTAYFVRRVQPQIQRGLDTDQLSGEAKFVASLSLVLWTAVIILGRFIPYVEE